MSKTVIDELVTILGLETDPKLKAVADKFGNTLDGITKYAKWAGAALVAAAGSIGYFIQTTSQGAGELYKFQQLTGIATGTLQSWQYAAEKAGGSSDALTQDLMSLTKNMSSPIPGEFNHGLFMLGIHLRNANGQMKSADQILMDVADKFQGMSKQHQIQWASRIGISDETLLLLQRGRGEIQALFKEAADIPVIVDEKHLKAAREFTIQLTTMRRIITYISQTIASVASPILKEIVKDTQTFLKTNKELIRSGLTAFIEGLVMGFRQFWGMLQEVKDVMFKMIPGVENFIKAMGGAETVGQIVFIVLTALAAVLAVIAIKFILISAAILLVVAIFEDLIVYFKGGESVTGRLIKALQNLYKEFATKFPNISAFLSDFWSLLVKIGSWTGGQLAEIFKTWWTGIKLIAEGLEKTVGWLMKATEWAMKFKIGDLVNLFLPMQDNKISGMGGFYQALQPGNASGTGGNTFNITQNISGSNAPAIAAEVTQEMKNSFLNMYPGGLAPVSQ